MKSYIIGIGFIIIGSALCDCQVFLNTGFSCIVIGVIIAGRELYKN